MDLWIRSQDKEQLMKCEVIMCEENRTGFAIKVLIENYKINIANYKTKERALEILDEIQEFIEDKEKSNIEITSDGINQSITYPKIVYEMPKE